MTLPLAADVSPAPCAPISAESLNRGCACRSVSPERLRSELEADASLAGLLDDIRATRPHLFSELAVFISPPQLERMTAIVAAVEEVIALPSYREAALARAPAIARVDHGPRGVFTGFDFHLGGDGPQLIEINTNSGGALLNAALLRAQQACCVEMSDTAFEPVGGSDRLEETFFAMFMDEWRSQRGDAPLGRVAIVDDAPAEQYLYPEFRLFQRLFARFGVEAVVADAKALEWRDEALSHEGRPLDLVYNRLTDFHLEDPAHASLRAAHQAGAVVLTPHPRAHALYADKRNLVMLSDAPLLEDWGVSPQSRGALAAGVPRTEPVSREDAEALWARRRHLFFKPAGGYGSKAAYRGDKLTRRVWEDILAGDYVAQALVPPSGRLVEVDGVHAELKLDVRAYAHAGRIQMLAARLYRGQTTNMRTEGGGFASVFLVPAPA
jgi:hypothetical protein